MNRFEKAFLLFDEYNQQDPHSITWNDVEYPAEYFYALQLYNSNNMNIIFIFTDQNAYITLQVEGNPAPTFKFYKV